MTRSGIPTVLLTILVLLGVAPVASAHYETTTGRWIERDPIGYANSMNLVEYVRSAPTAYSDPSGLKLQIDPGKLGGGNWDPKRRDGRGGFKAEVYWALRELCPEVTVDANGVVHVPPKQDKYDKTENCGKKEDCTDRPGCDILRKLIDDPATHWISEYTDNNMNKGPEIPANLYDDVRWNTATFWKRLREIEITTTETGNDNKTPLKRNAKAWEILWHELIHTSHTADGTRVYDKPGWEEVFTIEEMNKLRDWWNKCMRGDQEVLAPRDPFTHAWSIPLQQDKQDRPERPAPVDRSGQNAPEGVWPLKRFIDKWENM